MQYKKVLVTDKVHPLMIEGLKDRGYDVTYDTSVTLEELKHQIHQWNGIVINSKIIMDRPMIDAGVNLAFIARLGSGMEIIDRPYAESKGIVVVNSPAGNRDAVAEHTIGMLLALFNNLNRANQEVKNFIWNREANRGIELMGKTIGIIGFGNTGSSVAKKLSSWDMNIIFHDKYLEKTTYSATPYQNVNLEDILTKSDIITLHLPLTPETKHYVNDDFISKCKKGVVLVNTSRGQVIDTRALVKGLKSGKISGACLDVFENEKVDTYSEEEKNLYEDLFAFENVLVSPHVAGWTIESLMKISTIILEKLDKNLK